MKTPRQYYEDILGNLREHHESFKRFIPLIASENITSPAVREALTTDFGNRYAEGWVGERVYAGCEYIDRVESICIDLMSRLFKAEFIDPRPISGVISNLVVYTAFTEPGDTVSRTLGGRTAGGTAGAVPAGLSVLSGRPFSGTVSRGM